MNRWKYTVLFGALCLGLVLVFYKAFGTDPHAVPFMLKDQPAPDFTMKELRSGQRMSLAQLKGRPTVMNFWASWCGPCRYEHPFLEWGAQKFGDQVNFVGVVFEDTEPQALQFLRENGASFPQLFDERGQISVEYGLAGVPETYFIDHNGIILYKHVGAVNPNMLSEWVAKLTARQAAAGGAAGPAGATTTNNAHP